MATYAGYFRNLDDEPISVVIYTDGTYNNPYTYDSVNDAVIGSPANELILAGEEPVTVTINSGEGLFSPLKLQSAKITLVTENYIPEIYSSKANYTKVVIEYIKPKEYHGQTRRRVIFKGYLTPEVYSQNYIGVDTLELECVSAFSELENFVYPIDYSVANIKNVDTIISTILNKTGMWSIDDFVNECGYGQIINKGYQLYENNFFDDDEEHEAWNCKKVLEEILKFFCLSLVEYEDRLYLIDYYKLNDDGGYNTPIAINADTMAGDDTQISLDDTYQKIIVVDNQYPIADGTSVEDMIGKAKVYVFDDNDNPTEGVDYIQPETHQSNEKCLQLILDNTFCLWLKAYNRDSNKRKKNISFMSVYTNPDTITSYYYPNGGWCMSGESEDLPTSLTYKDLQTATTGILAKTDNKEVDNYKERVASVRLTPSLLLAVHALGSGNGMSEMAFNAYQPLWRYKDKITQVNRGRKKYIYMNFSAIYNYVAHNTGKCTGGGSINNSSVMSVPPRLCTSVRVHKQGGDTYYLGYGLGADDNYIFTSTSGKWSGCTFNVIGGAYEPYWERPEGNYKTVGDTGRLYAKWYKESENPEEWITQGNNNRTTYNCRRMFIYMNWETGTQYINTSLSLPSNIDWTMGLDKDSGMVIPIDGFELERGDELEIIFYKPAVIGSGNNLDCVLLDSLEINVIEEQEDKIENGDEREDVIYTNTDNEFNPNGTYIGEKEMELLINTSQSDMPQSYSYVLQNGLFVNKLYDDTLQNPDNVQEENIIVKYYEHYKQPKVVIDSSQCIYSEDLPLKMFTYMNKNLLFDSCDYDVQKNINKLKLIEF